jgi:hypothetical protein
LKSDGDGDGSLRTLVGTSSFDLSTGTVIENEVEGEGVEKVNSVVDCICDSRLVLTGKGEMVSR